MVIYYTCTVPISEGPPSEVLLYLQTAMLTSVVWLWHLCQNVIVYKSKVQSWCTAKHTFDKFGIRENIWIGDGNTNCIPRFTSRLASQTCSIQSLCLGIGQDILYEGVAICNLALHKVKIRARSSRALKLSWQIWDPHKCGLFQSKYFEKYGPQNQFCWRKRCHSEFTPLILHRHRYPR